LNFGIAKARGEIIALLDADDLFLPGKLARNAEVFQQNPDLGMAYHPLLEWNMQTNERHESNFLLISGDLHTVPNLFSFYVPHPTSCISFRRSALDRLLPVPEDILMLADAYLVNLIPFLSPILAVPEPLVVYRIHGSNHFYADERRMLVDARKIRMQKWRVLIEAMQKWLAANAYTRKQTSVRTFLNGWTLYQKKERFLIEPPGRLRFFWFVVWENYVISPIQTWKLTAFNYLCAPLALFLGFRKADRFYKWRGATMKVLERLVRAVVPGRP
jgi:glycosyltransferase involved in cell wall biosynthesis